MAKILILIGAHLCTAPRPQKEAETLAQAGHEVVVRGVWFDPKLIAQDCAFMAQRSWRFAPVLDFRPQYRLIHWLVRLQARLARQQFRWFGRFSPALLGYGAKAMLQAALQEKADLTIVHSEAGLWVGAQLLHQGYRVGVDFEDWFSQDLLATARTTRPIGELQHLEQFLIQHCAYCLTTSHALATALAQRYQAAKPTVIYNVFPNQSIGQRAFPANTTAWPSVHWFSQTIGPGRGLETLFESLPYLKQSITLHLRGNCSDQVREWLNRMIPAEWRDRIFIHPTVPSSELLDRIAEHDIGLALEQTDPPSRNLTITNKLFQYLQAGLAVIATDTAGQREVFAQYPAIGHLIPPQDPIALAAAITAFVGNPTALQAAQAAARQAAEAHFCWERQQALLLQAVDRACHSSIPTH